MYMLKYNHIIFLIIFIFIQESSFANEEKFLSLKKNKVNVRYGPGFDFPIKYIYKKINLPIKQIDKKENFRRIIDYKKNSGWIHISQLKKLNSVITEKDKILFKKPSIFSKPIANNYSSYFKSEFDIDVLKNSSKDEIKSMIESIIFNEAKASFSVPTYNLSYEISASARLR